MPKKPCNRCFKGPHQNPAKCRAREAVCYHCHKKGHYSRQCFQRNKTADLKDEDENLDGLVLDAVTYQQGRSWTISVSLQGSSTVFKIDTGAETTVITPKTF